MTEQENNLMDLQRHSAVQDARISNLETKFEMFMQSLKESNERRDLEMRDFKQEMREQNRELRTMIDGMGKHVRNLAITSMIGIITAAAGIAAMVLSVIHK